MEKEKEDLFYHADTKIYIEFIKTRLESVMPEVHRQVKVYEDKLKTGKLTDFPKSNPLFS